MFNHLQNLTFREAGIGSNLFNLYVEKKIPNLNWVHAYPDEVDFEVFGLKRLALFPENRRTLLVNALTKQYHTTQVLDASVEESLFELAKPNTVCVTTGHQLGFGAGPLFLLYKIASVIALARKLNQQNSKIKVVPIFWMNSDDHDLEEVNSFYWQNRDWTIPVEGNNRPVGDYLCPDMHDFWAQLSLAMPKGKAWDQAFSEMKEAYKPGVPLGLAFRRLIAKWTHGTGLICLDQQDFDLKRSAWNELSKLLKDDRWFDQLLKTTQEQESQGFKAQVKPMPSLFFYHSEAGRERIEKHGQKFISNLSKKSWDFLELQRNMDNEPHRFSTNVTGRALYQEFILPNVSYIGGAAEIRYWMQFSGMFRSLHFPFPVLIPRETFLFLGPREIRYIEKTNRTLAQLIGKKETVLQHCIKESFDAFSDEPWNKILTEESEKWAGIFAEADPTLQAAVMAKFANLKRDLKALNAKRIRSIKHKEQNLVQRLEHLQDWMQPKGILQERIQHPWLLGPELKLHFQELLSHSNPIQNQVVVLKF